MTNEITNEELQRLKREANLGNVKAVNVDAPVLLALIAKVESLAADAEMFAWIYAKKRTESNEMIALELRMLNDDYPTIEEVRTAVADAMAKEKA